MFLSITMADSSIPDDTGSVSHPAADTPTTGRGSAMNNRSNTMVIMGIVTLVAVLAVLLLLGVDFWLATIIAVVCALAAQLVTGRQARR
jgi:hypothetical protein